MLSPNLEETIHRSMDYATQRRHEFATLEHLMLGLCEDPDAVHVLRACDVETDRLSSDLIGHIDEELDYLVCDYPVDPRPSDSFTRALQRAAIHVQSTSRDKVTGANVLVAIFSERESHAVYFLQEQGMTRWDAVNFIGHGIVKVRELSEPRDAESADSDGMVGENWRRWGIYVPQGLAGLSGELEEAVERAIGLARKYRHEFATLEHLLLSLTESEDVLALLAACKVDVDRLRRNLSRCLEADLAYMVGDADVEPRAAESISRVLVRAAGRVRSVGKKQLTGVEVMASMFDEADSRAVFSLREHHIMPAAVFDYLSGGKARKGRRG